MNNQTPYLRTHKLLAIGMAVLLGTGVVNFAFAADKTADAASATKTTQAGTEEQINFPGWDNPFMGRIAYYSGQLLIQHLQTAQQALADNKTTEALQALREAKTLASGIREMMPFTVVVDQVKNAKGDLVDSESAIMIGDLLPVYKSLEQMEPYAPKLAHNAREILKQAEADSNNGHKDAAIQKLDKAAKTIADTTVYMPVLYVSGQIDKAISALKADQPDTTTAKAAVDSAFDSFSTTGAGAVITQHHLSSNQ